LSLVAAWSGDTKAKGISTTASLRPSGVTLPTRPVLTDANITGWLKPGICAPSVRQRFPKLCGVVSVDRGVRVETDHPLTVSSGHTRVDAITLTVSPGSRVVRRSSQPLPTVITNVSRRALGGTIALPTDGLLPDEVIARSGPQPVEIDAITFVGTPPLQPGHYLLWVILDGYDVDPTTVAPALDLTVTST
jgi:hypothetical protein